MDLLPPWLSSIGVAEYYVKPLPEMNSTFRGVLTVKRNTSTTV